MRLKLSHSGIQCFKECPRKFKLSRVDRMVGLEGRPLRYGSAMHEGLNTWHRTNKLSAMLQAWDDACSRYKLDKQDRIQGEVMLLAYAAMYPAAISLPGESKVELGFVEELIEGVDIRGHIDLIDDDAVIDHKNYGSFAPSRLQELDRDPQIPLYMAVAGIDTGVFDLLLSKRIPMREATPEHKREYYKRDCAGGKKGELKKDMFAEGESPEEYRSRVESMVAENPDDFFKRVKLPHVSVVRFVEDAVAWGKIIKHAVEVGSFPRNEKSCSNYGGCEYQPVCWDSVDIYNSELYQRRKDR